MNMSWIFCFTFLLLIHTVSVQSVRVEGFIGETKSLPCKFGEKLQTMHWRYNNSRTVCDIRGGEADFDDQHPVYKHRVNISQSGIEKGDFSITLSNLNKSDTGTYTCIAPNIKTLTLELTVKEREEEKTTPGGKGRKSTSESTFTPGNGDSPRRADGLLTFLLGYALLYSLTF